MPEDIIKEYTPLPTLRKFHEDGAQIRAIVGPVGSGKTTAASWEICYFLPFWMAEAHKIKTTRWLILRNTYSELIDTTQKTVFDWFSWGDYKVQQKDYKLQFPDQKITVDIMFRSCDNPADVKKFKSLELTGYWIDESIEVKDEIKLMLKNRIGRYPKKCPVRFGIETTNPPDIEHTTYSQFKWLTDVPGPVTKIKPLNKHHGFWQPQNENVANLRKGYYLDLIQDYADNPDWIARYIRGEPGVTLQGKTVYNNFRKDLHVAKDSLVFNGDKLYAGWDNTGNCPACIIGYIPTPGVLHILAEYHTERMGIVDFTDMVISDRNNEWPGVEWVDWGDPAGESKFSKSGGGLTSNADLMRNSGILLKPSEQNWEARRESIEFQCGRLVSGEPAFLIDPSCTRLINGFIGGYCYAETGTTGIYGIKPIKNKYSHVHDALQYMVVMLLRNVGGRAKGTVKPFTGFANFKDREKTGYDGGYREVMVG